MKRISKTTGFILVISGAIFWGVGGTVSQKLFQEFHIEVDWLVTVRLLSAGFALLIIQFFRKDRSQIFRIWSNRNTAFRLLVYGLAGMLAVQYTYMASIDRGNAAVATLLQYMAPVLIIIYTALRKQTVWSRMDALTVTLALTGSFLLLTNGSVSQLSVPLPAAIWGLLSAVALAFYTLYPIPLLKQFDSLVIVGWAMMIGGLTLSFIHPPWKFNVSMMTAEILFYILFVIIFGTMLSFWFYIESLQYLQPKETSLLSCLEPLASVLTTVFWLNVPFGLWQWAGSGLMILMIMLLALTQKENTRKKQTETLTSYEQHPPGK